MYRSTTNYLTNYAKQQNRNYELQISNLLYANMSNFETGDDQISKK